MAAEDKFSGPAVVPAEVLEGLEAVSRSVSKLLATLNTPTP